MSLFPAYSDKSDIQCKNQEVEQPDQNKEEVSGWLQNSSFQTTASQLLALNEKRIDILSSSSEEVDNEDTVPKLTSQEYQKETKKKKKNKKNKKSHSSKKIPKTVEKSGDSYFKDEYRNTMFLTLDTIKDMRPKYRVSFKYKLGFPSYYQYKKKSRRYYKKNLYMLEISSEKSNKGNEKTGENIEELDFMNKRKEQEEKLKLKTAEYNRKTLENPKEPKLWLEYCEFQNEICKNSKIETDNLNHSTYQKKLCIIEKGRRENPDSIELLEMKLYLMQKLIPTDEFANQMEALIQKDPKNSILWETLIMAVKTSCAICTVSKVLDLYIRFFQILRQKSKCDPKSYDKHVSKCLLCCLTFLRHAGFWEQMWEIIRVNLCLNLDLNMNTLIDVRNIDEKDLINMEELILNSKLPLNQLWLRVESLRESCHWTSVNPEKIDLDLIGDAKRLVSSEDITDFVYPMISKDINFHLVVMSILSLKVPLIPTRHCALQELGLEKNYWCIETFEYILPMVDLISNGLDNRYKNRFFIQELIEGELTSGPQVLKFHPTQGIFLDFIRSVFKTVTTKLTYRQRTSILVWWLKFEKLLIHIVQHDPLVDEDRNKKLKSIIKDFMKQPENRNNVHFYREYAIIERELGNDQNCLQILETIIQSQSNSSMELEEKFAIISLFRTLFEVVLDNGLNLENEKNFQKAMKNFKDFLSNPNNQEKVVEEILTDELAIFLENSVMDESEELMFLPNVYCDILASYSYIQIIKNIDKSNNFIEDIIILYDKCIKHTEHSPRIRERFFEEKLLFSKFCLNKGLILETVFEESLEEGLNEYPSNFLLLSQKAVLLSKMPFWKLKVSNGKLNIWSAFATCLAERCKISYFKNIGLEDSLKAMVNKLLSYHRLLATTKNIQGCSLIWRLYMLLLREHNLQEKKGEEVYYEAVAQCPWVRSIYINAAEIAPQILSQIQDLIREKELRVHVTPEELDILRG